MIKYRRHLRFALESRQPFGILPQSGRKKLDVDFAVEFNVARGLHLVHAIRAQGHKDFVATEFVSLGAAGGHNQRKVLNGTSASHAELSAISFQLSANTVSS
jgi:hypothetical protein